jgi:hypothetical protein
VTGQQLSGKADSSNPEKRTAEVRKSGSAPYIYRKEENKEENIAETSTTAQSAAPLRSIKIPDISFSFDERNFKNITEQDLKDWKELYPTIDIQRELKEMIQWILSNPSKAKSKKHWRKFIVGWIQRQNEKLTNRAAYQSSKEKQVLSRHTGFTQNQEQEVNPNRVKDYRHLDFTKKE